MKGLAEAFVLVGSGMYFSWFPLNICRDTFFTQLILLLNLLNLHLPEIKFFFHYLIMVDTKFYWY